MSIQSDGIRSILARRQAMLGRNAAPAAAQNDPGQQPQAGSYNDFAAGSDYMSNRDYEEAETSALQKSMSDRTTASQSQRTAQMHQDARDLQGKPVLRPPVAPPAPRDPNVAPPMRIPDPARVGSSSGPVTGEMNSSEVQRDPILGAATADAQRRKDRASEQRKQYDEGVRPLPRVDPKKAQEQASAASGRYKPSQLGATPEQKASNRVTGGTAGAATAAAGAAREAATTAADAAQYDRAMTEHDAKRMHLESKLNTAYDTGFGIEEAAAELDAHNAAMPKPPSTITGGRTPQEMEQSVRDTYEDLSDEAKDMWQRRYGNLDRMHSDLEGMYADLDPDERRAVMENDARRAHTAGKGGGVDMFAEPGKNNKSNYNPTEKSGEVVASVAPNAGTSNGKGFGNKHGDSADPDMLTPEQKRMRGHDYANGVPVKDKGGTFVENPNGSHSSRAVHPEHLPSKSDLDPNGDMVGGRYVMTPEWREKMTWAGHQMGLDASKFEGGDQSDAWIAATQDKLRHHQTMTEKGWEPMPVATGGYRYAPGQKIKEKQDDVQLKADAREFIKQYPPRLDANGKPVQDDDAVRLQALADGGNANRQEYNELKAKMRSERNMQTSAAARTQLLQRGETQNWNSPTRGPGMLRDSLRNAGDDPKKQAQAYRIAGVTYPALNAHAAHLENTAAISDAAAAQAEIARFNAANENMLPSALRDLDGQAALDTAFDDQKTPDQVRSNVIAAHASKNQNAAPMTPEQASYWIASHVMRSRNRDFASRINNPNVQHALMQLLVRPDAYKPHGAEGDPDKNHWWGRDGYSEQEFVNDAVRMYGEEARAQYQAFYQANKARAGKGK